MKILKILTLTALLNGCSVLDSRFTAPEVKPVEIVTIEKPAPMYHPATMGEYLEDLKKQEAPAQAFYGLTNKGYENLSNNIAEVKRYIRQLLSINEYYRNLNKKEEE